ncbi:unnamed protein product [Linum trigynum]|uniref:F-box domain-containing protein n=1 Tax=Linum trigynum TaxID=586398 RepID=A0AAV2F704_9ROSI
MGKNKRRRVTLPSSPTAAASIISDLPDNLLHNIFSFLPPKTVSQLCILSNRFYSAWNSTPSLSFHHSDASGGGVREVEEKRELFIDYISYTLARRAPSFTLDEFRIQAPALALHSSPAYHDDRVDAAIDRVLSRGGLRVLDLELGTGADLHNYLLPPGILAPDSSNNASLTSLRLSGFQLDPARPSLRLADYPHLESLTLRRTLGIESLEISCPKLKSLEVDSCTGLVTLTLDPQTSSRLESFSFVGKSRDKGPYDLKIPAACPSLTRISVSNVSITGKWAADVAARLRSLESLILTQFDPLSGDLDLSGGSENLQLLQLEISSRRPVGVRVRAPNLHTLKVGYKDEKFCREFDISGCGSLEKLELFQVCITGEWIDANLRKLGGLKFLELRGCSHLEGVRVHHRGLERLVMEGCNELKHMEIVADSLGEFRHSCSSLVPRAAAICGRGLLVATLGLPSGSFGEERLAASREFLKSFGQCRHLTLVAASAKDLIIDAILRDGKTAPMYDLRSLKTVVKDYPRRSGGFVTLVDSLLWLAPHVSVLSLRFRDKRRTLKLNYYVQRDAASGKDELLCCDRWWPIKCWRHTLRKVTLENFEPWEEADLVQFFRLSAARLEAVYADARTTIFDARAN